MSQTSQPAASFFTRFLTSGHLLARWIVGLLVMAGLVAAAYQVGTTARQDASPAAEAGATEVGEQARRLAVRIRPLHSAGPDFMLQQYTGIVAPRRSSELAAKSVGRVESIEVKLGDRLQPQQLLIRLDTAQLTAQEAVAAASLAAAQSRLEELTRGPRTEDIQQAESLVRELQANLELSKANFERLTQLRNSSAISKQEYDESRFALNAMSAKLAASEQALALLEAGTRREQLQSQKAVVQGLEAQLKRIRADLSDQHILAPFEGFVQARYVDEGAVVSPGQALLQVVEAAPYEVRVGLPADLVTDLTESNVLLKQGQRALVGALERMSPAIREATRTREVVFLLSRASSQAVSLGSAVSVSVRRPTESSGFWVPTQALTAGPRGLWALYVAKPEDTATMKSVANATGSEEGVPCVITRRQVELIRANGEWSEVGGPLSSEEWLVIEGVHRVSPGQRVRGLMSNATDDGL